MVYLNCICIVCEPGDRLHRVLPHLHYRYMIILLARWVANDLTTSAHSETANYSDRQVAKSWHSSVFFSQYWLASDLNYNAIVRTLQYENDQLLARSDN